MKEGRHPSLAHLVLHVEPGLAAQSLHHGVQRRPRLLCVLLAGVLSGLRPHDKRRGQQHQGQRHQKTLRIYQSSNRLDGFRRPMQRPMGSRYRNKLDGGNHELHLTNLSAQRSFT